MRLFFYFKISDIKPVTGQGLKGGASNCDYILRQGGGDRNTSRIRGQQFDEFLCFRHGWVLQAAIMVDCCMAAMVQWLAIWQTILHDSYSTVYMVLREAIWQTTDDSHGSAISKHGRLMHDSYCARKAIWQTTAWQLLYDAMTGNMAGYCIAGRLLRQALWQTTVLAAICIKSKIHGRLVHCSYAARII